MTSPVLNNSIPGGIGPLPPDKFRADSPKKPHLNVVRFLEAMFLVDGHWTLAWHRDVFLEWNGTHWGVIAESTLRANLYEVFESAMWVGTIGTGPNAVPAWIDFDIDVAKMVNLMSGIKDKVLVNQDVDFPTWLSEHANTLVDVTQHPGGVDPRTIIPCRNGLLVTGTRTMWRHTPRLFNQYAVDYDFSPSVGVPVEWLRFLASLWPDDQESIDTLQEIFGYLMTQRNELQKLFYLYGSKRGGKGTIIRVLTAVIGSRNVTPTSMSDLNEPSFGLAALEGKQLAIMSDVRFRSRDDGVATERLLKITGDDTVLINKKYRQPYSAHLTSRILIASNELPRMQDESGALQTRVILLKFTESFLGREDTNLESRLMTELPAILNWALAGLDRLDARVDAAGRKVGFVQPLSGAEDLNVISELSSPMAAFLSEYCIASPAGLVVKKDFYAFYMSWCADNGVTKQSSIMFGKALRSALPRLKDAKLGARGSQVAHWAGVALSDDGQVAFDKVVSAAGWAKNL